MNLFKSKKLYGILLILVSFLLFFSLNFLFSFLNDTAKIEKKILTNFKFLKNESKPIVLLYFGYTHCSNVCVVALNKLNELYPLLEKEKVSIYFINLIDNVEHSETKTYVESFNKDFKGITLNKKDLLEVTSKMKVSFSKSIFNNQEINHSGFLYLLKKEENNYIQKYVYLNSLYDPHMIKNDIKNILKDY